jgi:hypothetical protein
MSACSRNAELVYRNIHVLEILVSAVLWISDIHEIREIGFRFWDRYFAWVCECEDVNVCVCVGVSVNVCVIVCVRVCLWMYVSVCACVGVSVCLSVFVTPFQIFLNLNRLRSVFRILMIIYFPLALGPNAGHGFYILTVFKSHTTRHRSR